MTRYLRNVKGILLSLVALGLGLASAPAARANPAVYQKTIRSTAWIISPLGSGSGVLIEAPPNAAQQGPLVLTAYHVVEERPDVLVVFPDIQNGKVNTDRDYYKDNKDRLAIHGKVIAKDSRRDLAVIQLDHAPAGVRALPLAPADPVPAEVIHLAGNSVSYDGAMFKYKANKVTSVKRVGWTYSDGQRVEAVAIMTAGEGGPGDSGGPVFNERGEVVGIHVAGSGPNSLSGRSIALSEIRAFLGTMNPGSPADEGEYEALVRELVESVEEIATILGTINDEASARQAAPSLNAAGRKLQQLYEKTQSLGRPSPEVAARLKDKYEGRFSAALFKMQSESARLGQLPEVKKVLDELAPGFTK